MKKLACPALVFSLFLPLFAAAPDAAEKTPQTTESAVEIMEKGLAPFQKYDILLERMDDPLTAKQPFMICHIVFRRPYTYRKEENAVVPGEPGKRKARMVETAEYADVVIIPKDSPFLADNALHRDKEEAVAGPGEIPGLSMRKFGIRWRRNQSPIRIYTKYLGEDAGNYYFAQGNLSVLLWIGRAFALKNGFDVRGTLAAALTESDLANFTSRLAIVELAKYGNQALPQIKKSIADSLAVDDHPVTQFLCMKLIETPESDAELLRFADSDDDRILSALFQAYSDFNGFRPTLKKLFLRMVETRMAPVLGLRAAQDLGFKQDLLPLLQEYVRTPHTFEEFSFAVKTIFSIRYPDREPVQEAAANQIKLLLMRSGDLPGSLRVYDIKESDVLREDRLAKTDAERIQPYTDLILQAQETDLSILAALELATYRTRAEGVSSGYLKRVRRTGSDLLSRLPQAQVTRAFQALTRNLADARERELFEEAQSRSSRRR